MENQDFTVVQYETVYSIQSRKMVRKKLLQQQGIILDIEMKNENNMDMDFLLWYEDNGSNSIFKGDFVINDDYMLFHCPGKEILTEGKNLIKSLFSFTVNLVEERKMEGESGDIGHENFFEIDNRSEEESLKIIELFLNSSLDPEELGQITPLELAETAEGREVLRNYLEAVELVVHISQEQNIFKKEEIEEIKKRLGLDSPGRELLRDGVEKKLVKINKNIDNHNFVCDCIILWRDFKKEQERIRGRDRSWAAATEYLLNKIRYLGFTQKEIGSKYDVSSNTISRKYREIADRLGISIDYSLLF
ncbi:MAG: hypothetical protein ACOC4G_09645 [Bacillota bacterium]